MNPRSRVPAFMLLLAWQVLVAQPSYVPPTQPQKSIGVVAALNRGLNAGKLKSGDKVTAHVVQDVVVNGSIALPRSSKIVGHVAEVRSHEKSHPESRLALVFDMGQPKGGGTLALHGVIVAVAPPLVDPALEAIMASSSTSGQRGGRGGSDTPFRMTIDPREESAVRAIERREEALDEASNPQRATSERNGALGINSRGVFRLPGIAISNSSSIPTLISLDKNVELKSGSQIVISVDSVSSTQK